MVDVKHELNEGVVQQLLCAETVLPKVSSKHVGKEQKSGTYSYNIHLPMFFFRLNG